MNSTIYRGNHMYCRTIVSVALIMFVVCSTWAGGPPTPLGTAFTYQGELKQDGTPLDATADFEFRLWNALSLGTQVAGPVVVSNVTITDGRFTVPIDFGASVYNGDARWLEIAVASPAGSGPFTTLAPRQPLTPAPYALQTRGLYCDASGLIGIGTTAPQAPLDVAGTVQSAGATGGAFQAFNPNDQTSSVHLSWLNDVARLRVGGSGAGAGNGLDIQGPSDVSLMRISGGGRVGIGTASPTAPLHIHTTVPTIFLQDKTQLNVNQTGYISFRNTSGTETGWMGYGTFGSPHMSMINARTAGNIELRPGVSGGNIIVPTGKVGIGTSSPSWVLDVQATTAAGRFLNSGVTGNAVAAYVTNTDSSNSRVGVYANNAGSNGYDFYAGGSAGVRYGQTSSIRWKHNLQPIDSPLDRIEQIRGVWFDWDTAHGGRHDVGLIAEEVGRVMPEIVNYEANGIDASGMDYSKLTPLLVEAVKALRAEKDTEIASLRDANAELQDRIASLEAAVRILLAAKEGDK